jgi:hypothetical protein
VTDISDMYRPRLSHGAQKVADIYQKLPDGGVLFRPHPAINRQVGSAFAYLAFFSIPDHSRSCLIPLHWTVYVLMINHPNPCIIFGKVPQRQFFQISACAGEDLIYLEKADDILN